MYWYMHICKINNSPNRPPPGCNRLHTQLCIVQLSQKGWSIKEKTEDQCTGKECKNSLTWAWGSYMYFGTFHSTLYAKRLPHHYLLMAMWVYRFQLIVFLCKQFKNDWIVLFNVKPLLQSYRYTHWLFFRVILHNGELESRGLSKPLSVSPLVSSKTIKRLA